MYRARDGDSVIGRVSLAQLIQKLRGRGNLIWRDDTMELIVTGQVGVGKYKLPTKPPRATVASSPAFVPSPVLGIHHL